MYTHIKTVVLTTVQKYYMPVYVYIYLYIICIVRVVYYIIIKFFFYQNYTLVGR